MTVKNQTTNQPNDKLELKRRGPYKILEKVGYSFRLDLPAEIKIHPILYANRLRKAPINLMPSQYQDPKLVTKVGGNQKWEVELVKDLRLIRGRLEYHIDQKGQDPNNRWYPIRNFKNSAIKLRDFHKDYLDKPSLPIRLQRQIDATTANELDPNHEDDDKAKKEGQKRKTRKYGS